MTATRHRGLFTIPVTPFTPEGALDEDSLRRVLAFCFGPAPTVWSPPSTPASSAPSTPRSAAP